jgi:hypothetical protein
MVDVRLKQADGSTVSVAFSQGPGCPLKRRTIRLVRDNFRIDRYPGVIQPIWSLDISSISPERQEFSK